MGNSTISMVIFNSYVSHYRRVRYIAWLVMILGSSKKAGILSRSDPDCQEMTHEFDQTLRLRWCLFFQGGTHPEKWQQPWI